MAAEQDYQRGLAADSASRVSYLRRIAGVYLIEGKPALGRQALEDTLKADPKDAVSGAALVGLMNQRPGCS